MRRDNNNIIIFLLRYVTTAALKDYNNGIIYAVCIAPPQGRRTEAKETIKR